MSFKLSERITLNEGDRVRCSEGPYYVCKSGRTVAMGSKGKGIFVSVLDEKTLNIRFGSDSNAKQVYIGPEYTSDNGTIMRPHKITKLRIKK
jgi:hypothetical protein